MVDAVRKGNRVLQVGVQQRSTEPFLAAKKAYIDTGLGKVHLVRTFWNANGGYLEAPRGHGNQARRPRLGRVPGLAARIPWDPKRYFNRFSYWDVSTGGQTGGLFVHMVDVVHWYPEHHASRYPPSPWAASIEYDDGRDTPDNINFILDYPDGLNVTFEATITDCCLRIRPISSSSAKAAG